MTSRNSPRPIVGSIGSRIRIIFGDTGTNWLLLLDHDDGNRKWQDQYLNEIPDPLNRQINNCIAKDRYIKEVSFGPNGEWYVEGVKRDGSGGHAWWGGVNDQTASAIAEKREKKRVSFGSDSSYAILGGRNGSCTWNVEDDLTSRINRIYASKKGFNFIRLFHDNIYFISDDEGTEWKGIPIDCACSKELKKLGNVDDFAYAGDGSWVIISPNHHVLSTGVDNDLSGHITKFYNDQRKRNNKRTLEIQEHHAGIRRQQQAIERVEREAAERVEREALERVEREEMERVEREAVLRAERLSREMVEREAGERETNYRENNELVSILEVRIIEEFKDITEQEIRLQKRKRSLHDSIEKIPTERRARIDSETTGTIVTTPTAAADCVICHTAPSSRAIIPCGHHCLCDDCAVTLVALSPEARICPLCRGEIQSTLKIYSSSR